MPSALLTDNSTVLAADGWCKPDEQPEIFGVDRHGKVVPRPITMKRLREIARVVFLASKDSFGYFSAGTRLLDAAGGVRGASALVENSQISDVRFETVTEVPAIVPSEKVASTLWDSLNEFAAVEREEAIILRCRWPNKKLTDNVCPFFSIRRFGQHYYCILNKQAFATALRHDWSKTSDALASKWLLTPDGILQFHRDQFLFALWVLSAGKRHDQGVALQFETRQHTTCIFMAPTANQNLSGGTGASCFYVPTEGAVIEIQWEDRSWNPISSGFLLASN